MTKEDKQCMISALRAVEALCFQNLALELILERFQVPNWKTLTEQLAADPKAWPDIRARFAQVIADLENESLENLDAERIQTFLLKAPIRGKPN
jgi:hypothetical protein